MSPYGIVFLCFGLCAFTAFVTRVYARGTYRGQPLTLDDLPRHFAFAVECTPPDARMGEGMPKSILVGDTYYYVLIDDKTIWGRKVLASPQALPPVFQVNPDGSVVEVEVQYGEDYSEEE
jgi:hypothetical protein